MFGLEQKCAPTHIHTVVCSLVCQISMHWDNELVVFSTLCLVELSLYVYVHNITVNLCISL